MPCGQQPKVIKRNSNYIGSCGLICHTFTLVSISYVSFSNVIQLIEIVRLPPGLLPGEVHISSFVASASLVDSPTVCHLQSPAIHDCLCGKSFTSGLSMSRFMLSVHLRFYHLYIINKTDRNVTTPLGDTSNYTLLVTVKYEVRRFSKMDSSKCNFNPFRAITLDGY